jgi:succinate dehydrogenase / fumarate reductase membrane anchor subunit
MITPLKRVRGLGSAKEGPDHFWRQRVTAVANFLLAPFAVGLIATLAGSDLDTVRATIGHPVVAVALIVLILSMTVHMRIGMQVIVEDYVHSEGIKVLTLLANTFFCAAVAAVAIFAVLKLSFGS